MATPSMSLSHVRNAPRAAKSRLRVAALTERPGMVLRRFPPVARARKRRYSRTKPRLTSAKRASGPQAKTEKNPFQLPSYCRRVFSEYFRRVRGLMPAGDASQPNQRSTKSPKRGLTALAFRCSSAPGSLRKASWTSASLSRCWASRPSRSRRPASRRAARVRHIATARALLVVPQASRSRGYPCQRTSTS